MRIRATILVKLLAALVLPTVALFTLFAVIAHEVSRRDLDDELGRRLEAIAVSAASQIRGKYLVELAPGDEDKVMYQGAVKKLQDFAHATGARLSLFDRRFEAHGDSAGDTPIGTYSPRAEIDREELAHVFERGETASSVTFTGQDGIVYKAGYAPVHASGDDPTVVLALSAQAPASYFARLEDLRERLFVWGAGLVAISILAAVLTTLFITRNVRRLAAAAERIGEGDLRERVRIDSGDEIGQLGQAMERMRQQLAERDARTQQMLAGIAHEVRNPLAGMTLFAGILRDELPEGDDRRGHVDKIRRELGYLERVVNDFLEYARRPKPELATVPLGELLADVAQLASTDELAIELAPPRAPTAPVLGASISGSFSAAERTGDVKPETDAFPRAQADRGQLRRALLNLAKNAAQAAMAAGHRGRGAVRLSARARSGEVHISVWNRGAEIPPETSGKLFEPFFTTRERGTGLGLAFVREIAVDHGGRIEVASANGETTFTIVLPG